MKKEYNSDKLLRNLVVLGDICILNIILLCFVFMGIEQYPLFDKYTKICFAIANFSLFFCENLFLPLVHLRKIRFWEVMRRTFQLSMFTVAVFWVLCRFLFKEGGGMFELCAYLWGIFYAVLIVLRYVQRMMLMYIRSKGRNIRTVIFVGDDPAVLEMYNKLQEDVAVGYRVLGYYAERRIDKAPDDFHYLGNFWGMNKRMDVTENDVINGQVSGIDDLFCCLSHDSSTEIVRIMRFCEKNVIHFNYLPRQFGQYKLHLVPKNFMGKTIYTNHIEPLSRFGNKLLKRSFDILVSGILCLCILPFLPVIALCIKLQSPGPLFFKQARTGLNGKSFQCLKFRSMHVNKDADKAQATKNDPRKFAFGNFMRKTNIDEFPQFFNVLIGNMSIVGPRPHMLYHTEVYGSLIDKYMVRHFSKPGITGWAQVTGFRGETKELWQMEERVKRDIWYIENWSFWLDIKIIFMTAKSIIFPDKHAY